MMEKQDQDNHKEEDFSQEKSSRKSKFQSNKLIFFRLITWKCFVLPGVADTDTFLYCNKEFIVELLPTFGYPT